MSINPDNADFLDLGARLMLYELDKKAIALLANTWPIIASHVPRGIRLYMDRCSAVPRIESKLAQHKTALFDLYSRHLELVLNGRFDESYMVSFQRLREFERVIGLDDARTGITLSNNVLQGVLSALSEHFRYSTPKAIERVAVALILLTSPT
jgi:hypothetical protein